MRPQPIVFEWTEVGFRDTGELKFAMVPVPRYHNVAMRQFGEGGEYVLEQTSERSRASHSQYFAAMHDYFQNLPETVAARWPTEQHFRKWCLIEVGYFDERELEFASEEKAVQAAHFIRGMDEYARLHPHGNKLLIRRAKSQSVAAMGKKDFEASKKAVLELAESFVGVSPSQMNKEAGRSA